MNAKTKAAAPLPPMTNLRQASGSAGNTLTDARAKQVLKEAVDAVVNSFAKHTQGYGRAKINGVLKTGNKMVGGTKTEGTVLLFRGGSKTTVIFTDTSLN
ncbi:hypothetical protein M8J77_012592 [Diaphorina citri]|nr:hypothetical protein M8J77_012592 [Diaphorina citri]